LNELLKYSTTKTKNMYHNTSLNILPDEIPEDFAPLEEIPIETSISCLSDVLHNGNNVYLTTFDGGVYVGGFYWSSNAKDTFTVGQSDPIKLELVETARTT
jgi:hypothetical protein